MARIKASLRRKPRARALRDALYEYQFTTRKVVAIAADNQLSPNEITAAVKAAGGRSRRRLRGRPLPASEVIAGLWAEGWSTARLRERYGMSRAEVNSAIGVRTETKEGVWA